MGIEYSPDEGAFDAYWRRWMRDIETRITTMLAMARSMVKAARTEEDRAAAQAWVDRLERLGTSLDDPPPDQGD